jgi:hypothetical protein
MGIADFEELTVGGNKYYIYSTRGANTKYPWVGEVVINPGNSKPTLWDEDGVAWNNSTYNLVPIIPEDVYEAGMKATSPMMVINTIIADETRKLLRAAIHVAIIYDRRQRK